MDKSTNLLTDTNNTAGAVTVTVDLEKLLTPEEMVSFKERADAAGLTVAEHFQGQVLAEWLPVPRVPLLGAAVR